MSKVRRSYVTSCDDGVIVWQIERESNNYGTSVQEESPIFQIYLGKALYPPLFSLRYLTYRVIVIKAYYLYV